MKISNRLVVMLGAVLAIVLVGGATWAWAQDSGQVAVCIDDEGKVSTLGYDENVSCDPDKETKITWSITGPAGADGEDGEDGADGEDGEDGADGEDGKDGKDGEDGKDGKDGEDGEDGDAVKADPPCFDNFNRYVDCGNGTVTDQVTGLIWLKKADCLPHGTYAEANAAAAGLQHGECGLTDNSSPGDWRLPTKAEWEATVARALELGCVESTESGDPGPPSLTDTEGTGCFATGSQPFTGLDDVGSRWSSSTDETVPTNAWFVSLRPGEGTYSKTNKDFPWPVRGGQ